MPEQLFTIRQTSKVLALSERKVRQLCLRGIKYGGVDAVKIDSQWRVPSSELDRFVNARKGKH